MTSLFIKVSTLWIKIYLCTFFLRNRKGLKLWSYKIQSSIVKKKFSLYIPLYQGRTTVSHVLVKPYKLLLVSGRKEKREIEESSARQRVSQGGVKRKMEIERKEKFWMQWYMGHAGCHGWSHRKYSGGGWQCTHLSRDFPSCDFPSWGSPGTAQGPYEGGQTMLPFWLWWAHVPWLWHTCTVHSQQGATPSWLWAAHACLCGSDTLVPAGQSCPANTGVPLYGLHASVSQLSEKCREGTDPAQHPSEAKRGSPPPMVVCQWWGAATKRMCLQCTFVSWHHVASWSHGCLGHRLWSTFLCLDGRV